MKKILSILMATAICGFIGGCDNEPSKAQGGTFFLIRLVPEGTEKIDQHTLDRAVETIRKRMNSLGVRKPVITPEGTDRISVQIPGLSAEDTARAREYLRKIGRLEFRLVHPQSQQIIAAFEAGELPIPPGYVLMPTAEQESGSQRSENFVLVRTTAALDGQYVRRAFPTYDQAGWGVSLEFTSKGGQLFGELTSKHVGEQLAIILDGKVLSAPVVRAAIWGGRASISGHFTQEDVENLSIALENPLAVPVIIEEERAMSQ